MTDVRKVAQELRDHATHFAPRDWDYTRDTGTLRPLHHGPRWPHVKRALTYIVKGTTGIQPEWSPGRWAMARAALNAYNEAPDGVLDNGNIITLWEEDGEYLQYVQPSVGALLADLMDAHPDLPEVQAIATEMERIQTRYAERLDSKEE